MSVLTVQPDADPETSSVDGLVYHSSTNDTFSNLRSGSGTNADDSDTGSQYIGIAAGASDGEWDALWRSIFGFDTSDLTSDARINSATLTLETSLVDTGGLSASDAKMCLVSANPASDTALVAGDYDSLGTTELATRIEATGGEDTFTLNQDGLDYINKTGTTHFGLRIGFDLDNNEPSWADYLITGFYAEYENYEPTLEITYSQRTPKDKRVTDEISRIYA